jgi:DeoR/GlpR family transcriptional regulator of sugar metabolism
MDNHIVAHHRRQRQHGPVRFCAKLWYDPGVLASQRHAYILKRVRDEGGVRVTDLVAELNVSDMTIRRDLEYLHEQGLLEKVHGGATVATSARYEPGFSAKSSLQQAEKEAIAALAASMVRPGTAIGLSAGTTTYAMARHLITVPELTVVTNSVPLSDIFHQSGRPDQTLVLTGGFRTPSDALVGPFALDALRSVHVDLVFMGVHGMDPHSGFTTPNLLEGATNRALIEAGRRLIVLADHTKWGVIAISTVANLDQADVLISDPGLPPEARALLAQHVGKLLIAGEEPDEQASPAPPSLTATARKRARPPTP